ncbi:MAG: GntR family transcriptional regulator, partial [Chloroflexi bacterium]|nr:GntR family transcriptional regulator [Chloroflexota bacterium]
MIDLPFRPDRESPSPLHRQLADCLRALVESGRLPSGAKLPATRELATSLGLSRSTVTLAYEDLVTEGTLRAHVGQGTFVLGRAQARGPAIASAPAREFVWSGLFAQRARLLAPPEGLLLPRRSQPVRFDFRGGRVDGDSLPASELRRAFAKSP